MLWYDMIFVNCNCVATRCH